MKNFNIICFEPSRQPWKTIEWTLNFSVDAHAHYTHFVIDRSIIFPFWTGWSLAKACSEHDVLWTGTWYAIDQSANRKIKLWHLLYNIYILCSILSLNVEKSYLPTFPCPYWKNVSFGLNVLNIRPRKTVVKPNILLTKFAPTNGELKGRIL